jgi:hypothetical protein
MATDFIMPRLPDPQQQPYAAHFYPHLMHQQPFAAQPPASRQPHHYASGSNSRQISPLSTSNNTSPTSPKSYHGRQLRPLYIPAVLRPNDYPSKQTPTRKPEEQDDESLKVNGSWSSLPGLSALGRLSRRSTADSAKCLDIDWNLDMFPVPTAQPTRKHWKVGLLFWFLPPSCTTWDTWHTPDERGRVSSAALRCATLYAQTIANYPSQQADAESTICDEPSCMRHFNTWNRRHHCRRCGNIFCDSHSALEIPLDQDANYNPRGTLSRSCAHCYSEFQTWRSRTNSQSSSDDASVTGPVTAPVSPIASGISATPAAPAPNAPGHPKVEVAASVPRDWNWSTF